MIISYFFVIDIYELFFFLFIQLSQHPDKDSALIWQKLFLINIVWHISCPYRIVKSMDKHA